MPLQKKLVCTKLAVFDGANIEHFFFICIDALKKNHKKEENEQKTENNNISETDMTLSKLIDFENGKHKGGMCPEGHCDFYGADDSIHWKDEKDWGSMEWKCMECKTDENVQGCLDCFDAKCVKPRVFKGQKTKYRNTEFGLIYIACAECRMKNMRALESEYEMDRIKSNIIRAELISKPALSLDILCGLGRVMSLQKIMSDLGNLHYADRTQYCVFLIDIDDLKALNSCLGNTGADEVIKNVGKVMEKYTKQVNEGKWSNEYKIEKCYCFRFVYIVYLCVSARINIYILCIGKAGMNFVLF